MTDITAANTAIVLDFETTGLSPNMGDRAIEIGAIKIENGVITDRFQKLMNPGRRISSFIENYTGISNSMLSDAESCETVMAEFADFIEGFNLVAHNASFDQRFLEAELDAIGRPLNNPFACSLLISRRIYQDAPNHKLGTLVEYKQIDNDGVFHRALADAEVTAQLWLHILQDIQDEYQIDTPDFEMLQKLGKTPKAKVSRFLSNYSTL